MLSEELINRAKKLGLKDKLELAAWALNCDISETDNHGQIILYTGLQWTKGNRIRRMK